MPVYEIQELDLNTVGYDPKDPNKGTCKDVVIGKPGTGKSTLIGSLLYARKHLFPVGLAMSGSEDSNQYYQTIMPSTFVYNGYDEKTIEKVIQRQKLAGKHIQVPYAFLLLDDCTDDPRIFKKPLQNGIYKRGRHWKLWYIVSLQYAIDVPPNIRTNIDTVYILREPNLRNRHVLYENYASIIPSFQLFCELMDNLTEDYTALVIRNNVRTNEWQDCVFWYKATPPPKDFKVGCPEYWDFHYTRFNPEYVDPVTI
jgi:hypothetical protein